MSVIVSPRDSLTSIVSKCRYSFNVTSIKIHKCNARFDALIKLLADRFGHSVTQITICGYTIPERSMITRFAMLEELTFRKCELTTYTIIDIFANMKCIKDFSVYYCRGLSDDWMAYVPEGVFKEYKTYRVSNIYEQLPHFAHEKYNVSYRAGRRNQHPYKTIEKVIATCSMIEKFELNIDHLQSIAFVHAIKHLHTLTLIFKTCENYATENHIESVTNLHLDLNGNNMNTDHVISLLNVFPKLECLTLNFNHSNVRYTDRFTRAILSKQSLEKLKLIDTKISFEQELDTTFFELLMSNIKHITLVAGEASNKLRQLCVQSRNLKMECNFNYTFTNT